MGFFLKKPATSLGFNKTWRVPDPTIYLSTKIPSYIYSNKPYHLILISFHIFSRPHSPLPVSLSFPLLSSPLTTTATTEPHSLSSLLTTTTPTKPRNPYTGNAGAASSDGHFVLNISFTLWLKPPLFLSEFKATKPPNNLSLKNICCNYFYLNMYIQWFLCLWFWVC